MTFDSKRAQRRLPTSAVAILVCSLAGLAAFHLTFGLALLDGGHPYWIEPRGDMASMMAGFHALLDDRWRFPLTVTHRLRPDPVAVIYSDSLPWVAVSLKALGLRDAVNPLGLFLVLNYVLQPAAMALLLRACGVRRFSTLVLGGLLALVWPAWLLRHFGHIALGGHWILLLGLALSVGAAREGLSRGRIIGFAALSAVAVGVHAYHIVPLAACIAAAALSEVGQRRAGGAWRALILLALSAAAGGGSAWLLGYGVGQGITGGAAALGVWSMNAVAPVLPQASALLGQDWNGAWFDQTFDPTGAQSFEGFAYLGGGVMLALVAALIIAARRARRAPAGAVSVWRFGPLIAALVGLTLLAIGPRPYIGTWKVFDLTSQLAGLGDWIGLFRAHGRFFWAAGYALAALAVVQIDKLQAGRLRLALLVAVAALQAFDASQVQRGIRSAFTPQPTFYSEASLFRESPLFEARDWRFFPVVECSAGLDGMAIVQLSALAVRRHGTSNSGATARGQTLICDDVPTDALLTAPAGDRRLTLVFGDPVKDAARFERFRLRRDCHRFSRGLLCGPGLDATGLPPVRWPAPTLPTVTRFDQGRYPPILAEGWWSPDPTGATTVSKTATLVLAPSVAPDGGAFEVELEASAFAHNGPQRVQLFAGDRRLAEWPMVSGVFRARIPPRADPAAPVILTFRLPDALPRTAVDPKSRDPRLLGLTLKKLQIVR